MLRTVNIAWRSGRPLDSVRTWVSGSLLDSLRRAGYKVQSETATANSVGAASGTEWILLKEQRSFFWLPFSFLAFLWSKNKYQVVLSLSQLTDGRSELLVVGDVPGQIAKLLRTLAEPIPA